MLSFLKRLFKRDKKKTIKEPPKWELDIRVNGEIVIFHPITVLGAKLVGWCTLDGKRMEYIVGCSKAVDQEKFIEIWRRLGGVEYVWGDGTPAGDAMFQ